MKKQKEAFVRIAEAEELQKLFQDSEQYVVLLFYAEWCDPSQVIKEAVVARHRKQPSFTLALVNVNESDPLLSNQFKVDVIPRSFLLREHPNNIIADFIGADELQLQNLLQETTRHY